MINLSRARKSKGYSQEKLAQIIGVSRSAVAMWETGKTQPDSDTLITLSKVLDFSIDYLVGNDDAGNWIPVLGRVQAGIPLEAVEEVIDYEEISEEMASQGEYFALQIRGQSMEPKFSNGDVVIVRKQDDVDTNEIAVVLVNGEEATIKRIKKRPEGIMLIANNPAFEPMFYSNDEIEKLPILILGKVVELRAKF